MKNKLKKYAAIGTIAIMGLLLTNHVLQHTVVEKIRSDVMTMHIGFLKKMRLMPRFMIAYKITIFPHRSLKQ